MFANPVKQKLAAGKTAWGAAPVVADELAMKLTVDVGVDFVWVDLEHNPYGTESVASLPVIARRRNVAPLLRVPCLDQGHIKKVLDVGASIVMIPQVDNAAQAADCVRHAKYPPVGTRGISPMWTFQMNIDWNDYLPVANDETMVVAQVESIEALAKVEEIAAVDGIDVVFAGPMDLSACLGHIGNPGHPDVQKFLADFPDRVRKCGKVAGISVAGVEASTRAWQQGYRFINFGNLLWHGKNGLDAMFAQLKALES